MAIAELKLPAKYAEGLKSLLAQSPEGSRLLSSAECQRHATSWETLKTLRDVEISRQIASPPARMHKLRGMGVIRASPDRVFHIIDKESDKWDDGLKEFKTLGEEMDSGSGAEIEHAYARYGVGAGPFVADRDFVYTEVHMKLPSGIWLSFGRSDPENEEPSNAPKAGSKYVRGWMGDSGWVIAPLPDGTSHVTYVTVTDLKGSLPAFVVNKGSESQPMVVDEVRKLAEAKA